MLGKTGVEREREMGGIVKLKRMNSGVQYIEGKILIYILCVLVRVCARVTSPEDSPPNILQHNPIPTKKKVGAV